MSGKARHTALLGGFSINTDDVYMVIDNETMAIRCGRHFVLFDVADYDLINKYQWCVGTHGYATSGAGKEQVLMHRLLCMAENGQYVDHINMNKVDNRRANLRPCTVHQNGFNRGPQRNNTTGYKGVCKTLTGKYQAQLGLRSGAVYLGQYDTAEDAALAYDSGAVLLMGEFAYRNLPDRPIRETIFEDLAIIRRKSWLRKGDTEEIRQLLKSGYKSRNVPWPLADTSAARAI